MDGPRPDGVDTEWLTNQIAHAMRKLGLGLAVAEKLTRAQGGRLELSSTRGAGTTLSLYLPRGRG